MIRRTPIKKKSDKKILREEIGKLHFEYLKAKRGSRDELSGRPAKSLGRFHIIPISECPKLEFIDENVLLVNWMPLHYWWHQDYKKAQRIVEPLIIKLRGPDYRERLLAIDKMQPKRTFFYLKTLKMWFEKEMRKSLTRF